MTAALGTLAATFSIILVWPQVWLSCKNRRTSGLSATACWLAAALNVCWTLYGILLGDPAQIVTNSIVGVANAAILVALLVTQPTLRGRRTLIRTAWGALALLAAATVTATAVAVFAVPAEVAGRSLGALIALVGIASVLPQPISLLRDRTQDLSGLSMSRWGLTVGSCASWVGYGMLMREPSVWVSAMFGLASALVICAVLLVDRARAAAPVRLALAARRGTLRAVSRARLALAA